MVELDLSNSKNFRLTNEVNFCEHVVLHKSWFQKSVIFCFFRNEYHVAICIIFPYHSTLHGCFWLCCSGKLIFVFFRNYIKLAMLAFSYCFIVKSKIYSAKSLPQVGIEPVTLGLWDLLWYTLHAFPTELTWQVLIWGLFNFTCVSTPVDYWA